MAAALTLPELRGLARLHRQGVDGARAELEEIIQTHADELPEIVGFPSANLDRLRASVDPVDLLVVTVEAAARRSRQRRHEAQVRAARAIALELAASIVRVGAAYTLSVSALYELTVAWPGRGMVGFGDFGGIGIPGMRSFLRVCQSVDEIDAVLHADSIVLRYRTGTSRGFVRLVLHPLVGDDVVVVPLPLADPEHGELAEAVAAPRDLSRPADPPIEPPPPRQATSPRDRPSAPSLVRRFMDALVAVAAGAP